jgi:hypothetical protein
MMSETEAVIWELIAYTDQKEAELKDPNVSDKRKKEIYGQLSDLYKLLIEIKK